MLHPSMALAASSRVALRYEVGTAWVGAGTAWPWCPGWWGGEGGLQQWDWQCHRSAAGTPSASSAPPFCRGSCCLVTHRDHGWLLQLSTICGCAQRWGGSRACDADPDSLLLCAAVFGNTPGWPCTFLGSTHGPCALLPALPPWHRLAGGPEQHQAQLAAVGGGGRLTLAPFGHRSRA